MTDEIEPESFRDAPIDIPATSILSEPDTKVYSGERFVAMLRVFDSQFGQEVSTIYYPCSNADISPTKAIPNARVIYSDLDEDAMAIVTAQGLDGRVADATTYVPPEAVDAVIILNPTIPPDGPAKAVKPGGFVIANNYHESADDLRKMDDLEFVGGIIPDGNGGLKLDKEELEKFWQEIDTEEEFRNAPFSFTAEGYRSAEALVRRMFGPEVSVLDGYNRLRELIREQGSLVEDIGILRTNEGEIIINMRLPRKKGAADDIFVFKKKTSGEATQEPIQLVS